MSETEDTQPLQPDEDARPNAPGPGGAGKLEAGRDHVTDESIDVGSSAWRGQVLRQAYRLEEELDRLPVDGLDGPGRAIVASVRTRVAQAKSLARASVEWWATFRNWWTGSAVEAAWDDLQTAREQLMLVQPSSLIRAQLPGLQRRLATASPDPVHDPQVAALRSIAETTDELTDEQRAQIAAAHAHVVATQNEHTPARQFRNNLILWTAGLSVGALVLASITTNGFRYLVVGAIAGLLTTALAWRNLTHLSGPYSVSTAQAWLKVAAGAAAALLGIKLLRSGIISDLNVTDSTAYGYAVIFGFSQQAFTQAVDGAAKKLAGP